MLTNLFKIMTSFGNRPKSAFIDEPPHPASLTDIETLTIDCHVERDSVCAGDDAYAPNAKDFCCTVSIKSENFALDCIEQIACRHVYLPSVAGRTTWIAYVDTVPVAVLRETAAAIGHRASLILHPTGKQPDFSPSHPYFRVYLAYYMSNDEDRILAELANGQEPERRYGE